jgi:hypothetical protein
MLSNLRSAPRISLQIDNIWKVIIASVKLHAKFLWEMGKIMQIMKKF